MLIGVDASGWQKDIDWKLVSRSDISFAFVKCTEGISFTDSFFAKNWTAMKEAGIPVRGAYHFAKPSKNTPEKEAAHFVSVIDNAGLEPGDLVVLDLEDADVPSGTDLTDWTLRWLKTVEQAVGFKPMIYSGRWFIESRGLTGETQQHQQLAVYPLWLAQYI